MPQFDAAAPGQFIGQFIQYQLNYFYHPALRHSDFGGDLSG